MSDEQGAEAELDTADGRALGELLRTGPFPDALRAAIKARGLGLDRIQHRLRDEGVRISQATLSYWQSGLRQPERDSSLDAVTRLESVLRLPPGSLTSLLGPPRPRGRRRPGVPLEKLWPEPEGIAEAVSEVGAAWEESLTRVSSHDRVLVDAERNGRRLQRRLVLRAEDDGCDRALFVFQLDEHGRVPGEIEPSARCRVGQVVTHIESGLIVAELLFDHPLTRGETTVIEYALVNSPPYPPATHFDMHFSKRIREYVVEIQFDPAAVPVRCLQHSSEPGQPERTRVLTLDNASSVHAVALDFGPGVYGIRWDWG
ncbi:MAG: hypothetical protein ACRDT4_06900 [Micromonosporaceae bacterium]